MNLTGNQIKSRKVVGRLGDLPVTLVETAGGLHLVFLQKGGRTESIGCGPHRAVAVWMAGKREPGIVWSELKKSEYAYSAEEVACIVTLTLARLVTRGQA